MKKNLFYYLFAMICSVALFASCSDDDDEVTGLTIDRWWVLSLANWKC